MTIQEHYASLGANYSTIRSIKARRMFDTLEEAFEFWKQQKERKDAKKAELKRIANILGITENSVKTRACRRGVYKVDDTLLETKWKNIFRKYKFAIDNNRI